MTSTISKQMISTTSSPHPTQEKTNLKKQKLDKKHKLKKQKEEATIKEDHTMATATKEENRKCNSSETNRNETITYHLSPIINHQSSIINHQSSIINHQSNRKISLDKN